MLFKKLPVTVMQPMTFITMTSLDWHHAVQNKQTASSLASWHNCLETGIISVSKNTWYIKPHFPNNSWPYFIINTSQVLVCFINASRFLPSSPCARCTLSIMAFPFSTHFYSKKATVKPLSAVCLLAMGINSNRCSKGDKGRQAGTEVKGGGGGGGTWRGRDPDDQ